MVHAYLENNTVRFSAKFYNFDGDLVDPTVVKFSIYHSRYEKEEFTLDASNRKSIGEYFYDMVVDMDENGNRTFFYEFYGEIGGKPSINRGKYTVVFIE